LGRAIGRKAAAEMLMTGCFIDAVRATELGLINRAVPAGALDTTIDNTARLIAAKPPEAIALGKRVFARQMEAPLDAAYAIAAAGMVENLRFASAREGIEGFLARQASAKE